jgi:cell division protein FtsB
MAMDEHDVQLASDIHCIQRIQKQEIRQLVSENQELRERINQLEDRIARVEGRLEGDQ